MAARVTYPHYMFFTLALNGIDRTSFSYSWRIILKPLSNQSENINGVVATADITVATNLERYIIKPRHCIIAWHTGVDCPWWRHQMETFSALLAICAGNSPVPGEFPTQRPVTRSFDVFFDLRMNKRLSKQWWGWRFETPSRPLWRHCNGCPN